MSVFLSTSVSLKDIFFLSLSICFFVSYTYTEGWSERFILGKPPSLEERNLSMQTSGNSHKIDFVAHISFDRIV